MASKPIGVTLHAIEVIQGQKVVLVFTGMSTSTKYRRTYSMTDFLLALSDIMQSERDARMEGLSRLKAEPRRVSPRVDVYDLRDDDGNTLNLGDDANGPCIQELFSLVRKGSANVPRIRAALRDGNSLTIPARH